MHGSVEGRFLHFHHLPLSTAVRVITNVVPLLLSYYVFKADSQVQNKGISSLSGIVHFL